MGSSRMLRSAVSTSASLAAQAEQAAFIAPGDDVNADREYVLNEFKQFPDNQQQFEEQFGKPMSEWEPKQFSECKEMLCQMDVEAMTLQPEEGPAKEDRETLAYLQEKGLSREDAEEQLAVMKEEHITLAEVKAADQDAMTLQPGEGPAKEDRETLAYLQDKGLSREDAEEQLAVMKKEHITLAEVKAADQDATTLQPEEGQAAGPKPADAGPATFMEGLGLTADSGREEAPASAVSEAASKEKRAVSFGSVFCTALADNVNNMQNAVEAAENAGLSVEPC